MKMLHKLLPLLVCCLALLLLCSCSKKNSPEEIDTGDFSREIRVESAGAGPEIIHADKTTQPAGQGDLLKSDDSVRTDADTELVLNADGDKHVYIQGSSEIRLEASGTPENGKTRIHLDNGGVLADVEESIAEGELFQIRTDAALISIAQGVVRVSKIEDYTQIEV